MKNQTFSDSGILFGKSCYINATKIYRIFVFIRGSESTRTSWMKATLQLLRGEFKMKPAELHGPYNLCEHSEPPELCGPVYF